jgi:Flp pilus assembly protein TadG
MRRHDEHGAALIIVTIALVLIAVIAALVIDLGNVRQQKQQAQNVADAAALSASLNYSDTSTGSQSVWAQGFNSAFKTLNLTPPTSGWGACPAQITAGGGSGVKCYAATVGGKTVYVATPWNGNANWVHVATCWSAPAYFGKVIGLHDYSLCAKATAQYSGPSGGGGGGPPQSGCSSNDLAITGPTPVGLYSPDPTTAQSQLLVGPAQLAKGTVLSARYSDANGVALDPSTVVFLAPNANGVTVQVTPTISGSGASGSTTISYTLPATLASVTASLFVVNAQGTNCGQVVWSSCDFGEEDFFTSTGKIGGTTTVTPAPGATVSSSATLGATYNDETQMNPAIATMFLNQGRVPINFSPTLPCDTYVSGTCPTDIATVSTAVSVVDGTSQTKPGGNANGICSDGYANKAGGTVNVQLCDYMGDPVPGKTVQLNRTSGTETVVPATAVTGADGVASFTFSGNSNSGFQAFDATDGVTLSQTIAVSNNGKNAAVSQSFQLNSPVTWPASKVGKGDTSYQVGMSYPLAGTTTLAVGWNSAFIYTMDTDQNKAGGDCAWAVWSFTSTSGTGRATSLPTLVQ